MTGVFSELSAPPLQVKMDAYMTRLNSLINEPVDWDGNGAESPNEVSVSNGRRVLGILNEMAFEPTGVAPSAEGGVGISFVRGNKYADIECFNSGELWAVVSDRVHTPDVWRVEVSTIRASLEKIREHVQPA